MRLIWFCYVRLCVGLTEFCNVRFSEDILSEWCIINDRHTLFVDHYVGGHLV